ncbi:MAG: hypothetical protein JW947_03735 [Sedimentisphaerales bacterium]|nr:hypothetical protein [Sedimentisphaerales bacterium]
MNDPRGSIWRKWDLHVHTPCSLRHAYSGTSEEEQWGKFLTDLENLPEEFKVLGINDYIFLHGYKRILEEKSKGRLANIELILPVIELRLDKFGGTDSSLSRVNWHVIFSNEIEPEVIESQFINHLITHYQLTPKCIDMGIEWGGLITKESLVDLGNKIIESVPQEKRIDFYSQLHEGFNALNISLDKIKEAISKSYFNGKYLNAVGKTEWYDIKWNDSSIADKKTIINSADLVFISSETIADFEKAKKSLEVAHVNSLLLDCSDAHANSNSAHKDRIGNSLTWIKADTTFEGLKQIIREPEGRVYIGDEPEILKRVRDKKTKYISTISFKKNLGSLLGERWFEDCKDIPINPELVAIIGNKGSGKSALSDTIGLLGNSKQQENFSFLRKEKFCNPKDNKAEHFTACLKWKDGFPQESPLSTRVKTDTEAEMVAYIPQNYLERICSDEVEGKEFNEELRTVIFSHVEKTERLGCSSLEEFINAKTNEKNAAIEIIKASIHKLNLEIIKFEEMLHPNYKQELENKLKLKKAEKAGVEKPVAVKKPDTTDPERQKEIEIINDNIATKQSEIESYTANITKLQAEKIDLSKKINNANTLLQKLDNFQKQFDTFHTECDLLCASLGVNFEKIAKLELNKTDINTIKTTASTRLIDVNKDLSENNQNGPVYKLNQAKDELEKLKTALDQDNKNYQQYLKELQEWQKKCADIEGDEQKPEEGTIKFYEDILKRIVESIPGALQELKTQRSDKIREIYNKIDELKREYEQLYASVKDFMKSAPFSDPDKYLLDFDVSIECKEFLEEFFNYIAQNKKGSFYGSEEGKSRLRAMLDVADFNTYAGLEIFIKSIEENLVKDKREGENDETRRIIEQLRKEAEAVSFYDYLYCIEYLRPEYNLQWSGKKLHQLSPGERGLVLLIFYFFIDKKDIPLVIDQPKENLDNESVYKILVSCIKEAKKRRQIIIVTHNPNLAVVCDAEQIIYSEIDKQNGNRISYTCGAIENPIINKKLIDVLEGTRPAFDNRDNKYYVESTQG